MYVPAPNGPYEICYHEDTITTWLQNATQLTCLDCQSYIIWSHTLSMLSVTMAPAFRRIEDGTEKAHQEE